MNEQETLSQEKCLELLRAAIIGRVGFNAPDGPRILPVNYTTVRDAVVLRTTADSELVRHGVGTPTAFEIDHVDYADHRGWSVLAVGVAEVVEDVAALRDEDPLWDPKPWAPGARTVYVRLPWDQLSGRRFGGGWTYENELPVRRTTRVRGRS